MLHSQKTTRNENKTNERASNSTTGQPKAFKQIPNINTETNIAQLPPIPILGPAPAELVFYLYFAAKVS